MLHHSWTKPPHSVRLRDRVMQHKRRSASASTLGRFGGRCRGGLGVGRVAIAASPRVLRQGAEPAQALGVRDGGVGGGRGREDEEPGVGERAAPGGRARSARRRRPRTPPCRRTRSPRDGGRGRAARGVRRRRRSRRAGARSFPSWCGRRRWSGRSRGGAGRAGRGAERLGVRPASCRAARSRSADWRSAPRRPRSGGPD